jgi:excisionase family DNA binding protein
LTSNEHDMLRCWPAKNFENICVISRRGLIYTVEEVSDLLGIPRPTLYRYLREYSIPHLRRSGRISIPEDSFDRIREARDLHREGLGTESVRRLLREGSGGQDSGELKERLERVSETLERLRENGPATDEAPSSQALRTVLARQSLIMSAMFNLTEMVEELLLATGKPRKPVFEDVEGEIRGVVPPLERTENLEKDPATTKPGPEILPRSAISHTAARRKRFGSLARRRRRSYLTLLSALLVGVILMWTFPTLGGELSFLDGRKAEESSSGAQSGDSQAGQGPGEAVAQNPSAGNDTSGDAVGSGSSGPGEAVPDVSGQGVVEAARTLSGAGFEVAAIKTVTSQEETGTTTRTVPSAGSAVGPGTPVVLIVSGGPAGNSPAS